MAQADFHSLSWLHYEYLQQGRFAKARELMRTVEAAIASAAPASPGKPTSPPQPALPAPPGHAGHVESEIGRGYGAMSLKSELASMKARLVLENGDWKQMKGQPNFDNIDELFALGVASVALGDPARADAALEHLKHGGGDAARSRCEGDRADHGGAARGDDAARARRPGRARWPRSRARRSSRRAGRSRSRARIR